MGQQVYLIPDNCSSHTEDDIVLLCGEHNIEIVYLVPNTTHVFQLQNVCFFAVFKTKLRSTVFPRDVNDNQTRNLISILTAQDRQ